MYKVIVHLKQSMDGVKFVSGSGFDQKITVDMGFVTLFKTKEHSYVIPVDNVAYIEFIKESKEQE